MVCSKVFVDHLETSNAKKISETRFSANFESIHVVLKSCFDEFIIVFPFSNKMSDVATLNQGFGSELR